MSNSGTDDGSTPALSAHSQPLYLPLMEGYLRLLRISSASDDNIICELQHFLVRDSPDYFALSYVCGNGELDHVIIVDGCSLSVTQNLFEGILAISSFLNRTNVQQAWLWIDAVCIDQVDLEEKAKQVLLMDTVYRGATLVLVWFGKLHGNDLTSFQILEWCCVFGAVKSHEDERLGLTNFQSGPSDAHLQWDAHLERLVPGATIQRQNLEALFEAVKILSRTKETEVSTAELDAFKLSSLGRCLFDPDDQNWFHLLTFLSHPWFFRVWTIQEIRLARGAFLITDNSHLDWKFLSWFRGILCASPHSSKLFSTDIIFRSKASLYSMALTDVHNPSPRTQSDTLWCETFELCKLLEGIRGGNATLQKDYIYALLGLLADDVRSEITVDYRDSTSTEAVFVQAVTAACQGRSAALWPSLMETYANVPKALAGLPSWVPDFSGSSLGEYNLTPSGPNLSFDVVEQYSSLARMSFSKSDCVATVRGMCVDHVQSVISKPRTFKDEDVARFYANLDDLQSFSDLNEDEFELLFGGAQYLWFCEMESMFPREDRNAEAPPTWIREFVVKEEISSLTDVYFFLQSLLKLTYENGIKTAAEAREISTIYTDDEALEQCAETMLTLSMYTKGMYIFRTAAGRLGLAPNIISPGDKICLIPGAGSYLHILSSDGRRHLTANVSVDGLMGDDLLNVLPVDEHEWEDFHLH